MSIVGPAVTEFRIGKGRTSGSEKEGVWIKKYLELTVQMPQPVSEENLLQAVTHAEYVIDNWLGEPEVPKVPDFNAEELMKHAWKGKKIGENQYEKGSLSWGWDFRDQFSEPVIKVLAKGPLTVDKYEFSMGDVLVQAKESKEPKKERKQR